MGKCLVSIRRIRRWKANVPILIVTPYSAFDGWQCELLEEFETEAIELIGTRKKRLQILTENIEKQSKWFMINIEGFRALPEIADIHWACILADESRFLANPKTEQSKFYTNNFRNVPYRIILSGTPDYHHSLDYYQQLKFLSRDLLPYKNYWDFRNKAFHQAGYDFILKKSHQELLQKVLSKYCVFLRRKDINIGRKKIYIKRVLTLPRKFRPVYKTLEDEYVLEYKNTSDKTIYAMNAYTWMMRLCSGFVKDKQEWLGKTNEIIYLLKNELLDEQIVIGCRFKNDINQLLININNNLDLQKKGIDATYVHGDITQKKRRQHIIDFKTGKHKVLITQHSIIAHGQDLKNATTIIHYSQPIGEEIRDQFDDRIITLSDEKTVLIIDILVKDTVDIDTRKAHIHHTGMRDIFENTIKRRQKNGI